MNTTVENTDRAPSSTMPAIIFDCESTGLKDARIIEAGWIEVDVEDGHLFFGTPTLSRYNPEKPSDLGALNTHHILDNELIGLPSYTTFQLPKNITYVIGQNVDYDMEVIGNPTQYKRICTVGMSRKLWPEADSHSLGPMMYHVFGRTAETRESLKNAHNAMADCRMTWLLLERIIDRAKIKDLEQLYRFSQDCKLTTFRMDFGKYKGRYMADLVTEDPGYLQWLLVQPDMDEKVKINAAKLINC